MRNPLSGAGDERDKRFITRRADREFARERHFRRVVRTVNMMMTVTVRQYGEMEKRRNPPPINRPWQATIERIERLLYG